MRNVSSVSYNMWQYRAYVMDSVSSDQAIITSHRHSSMHTYTHTLCTTPSQSCLLPFYTIPILPLFNSKDFSFTCINMYKNHFCRFRMVMTHPSLSPQPGGGGIWGIWGIRGNLLGLRGRVVRICVREVSLTLVNHLI